MKLLVWSILFFYIARVKAWEGYEDNHPAGHSGQFEQVGNPAANTFNKLATTYISDILKLLMRNNVQSLTTDLPTEPSTTCSTTEQPVVSTTTEPSYVKVNGSLMTDVIVPIIQDIVNDEVALENITNLTRRTVEIILPLATEVFNASSESYVPGENSVIKISRRTVESTIEKLRIESLPLLKEIVRSRLEYVLLLLSYNTKVLFKSVHEMKYGTDSRFSVLVDKSWELYRKYADVYWNSTADFIYTYSPVEIENDIDAFLSIFNDDSRKLWRSNLLILQDVSGINRDTISKMLLDIPGIWDVINAIPAQFYFQILFLIM